MEQVSIADYIMLGRSLAILSRPDVYHIKCLYDHVAALIVVLRAIDGGEPFQLGIIKLMRFEETLNHIICNKPKIGTLPADQFTRLEEIVTFVDKEVSNQLGTSEVVTIERSAIADSLRALAPTITDKGERIFLAETLTCLECRAYRATIVMGWNLAFEHLRRWIFRSKRDRLKKFNIVLTRKQQPIVSYEDFFDLGERLVLELAYEAKLIRKQTYQVLLNALTTRNHFAHPSSRQATSSTASAHIEDLVINFLANPLFAQRRAH